MLSLRLNADPEFEALAQFVRDFAGLDLSVDITPSTLFEDDLGITGDDGGELLEAVAQHYSYFYGRSNTLLKSRRPCRIRTIRITSVFGRT